MSVYCIQFVADLALHLPDAWFDAFFGAVRVLEISLAFVTASLWIAMIIVIPLASIRAFRGSRRMAVMNRIKAPAASPDTPSDSN